MRTHNDVCKTEALPDDLKKEALMESIPSLLGLIVKEVILYRDMKEDTLSYEQYRSLITERIARDVTDQAMPMQVDEVSFRQDGQHEEQDEDWASGLGTAPR